LAPRVMQLERALALSLDLLHTLLERLEFKFGPGFLDEDLRRLTAGGHEVKEEGRELGALVQQGQEPKAGRRFRELTGVTWDEAHALIGRWDSYPLEQKVRWLQIAQWVKAPSAQPEATDDGTRLTEPDA